MKYLFSIIFLMPMIVLSQTELDKASALFAQGKLNDSQKIFESYLKQDANNVKALEGLGDIYGSQKQWDKALTYYEKIKNIKPKEANYHYKYGGVLGMIAKESNKFKALGLIGEIKRSFEKAIELDPKHIDARWALLELYIQLPGIVGGSEKKANRYASELLKLSPVDGYLSKGRIEEHFDRYKEAEIQYKKAIEVSGSKIAYQKLADLYKNKMKQPEKAKQILGQYNEKNK
jgi:tetratricopeptide (TPR) repeat protein